MKPTTETLIKALRAGLATPAEFAEHHDVPVVDVMKPLSNLVQRNLATRRVENGQSEYRLTDAGKAWKPAQRGAALRAAMRRTAA